VVFDNLAELFFIVNGITAGAQGRLNSEHKSLELLELYH
jgi:hypothetical protein